MDKTKAKIQELVPEIMELKFGCEFIDNESTQTFVYLYEENSGAVCAFSKTLGNDCYSTDFQFDDETKITILGRPITLADVLLAMYHSKKTRNMGYERAATICDIWDMTKTYDYQSQETKDFIGQILGVK